MALAGTTMAVTEINVTGSTTLTEDGVGTAAQTWDESKAGFYFGGAGMDESLTFEAGTYAASNIWGINVRNMTAADSITLTLKDGAKVTAEQQSSTFTSNNTTITLGDDASFSSNGSAWSQKMSFAGVDAGSKATLTLGNGATLTTRNGFDVQNSVAEMELTLGQGATMRVNNGQVNLNATKTTLTLDENSTFSTNKDIVLGANAQSLTLNMANGASIDWQDAGTSIKFGNQADVTINYGTLADGSAPTINLKGVCTLGLTTTINAAVDMEALLASEDKTMSAVLFHITTDYADRVVTLGTDMVHLDGWSDADYLGVLTLSDGVYTNAEGQAVDIAAMNADNEIYYALVKTDGGKTLSLMAHAPEPATSALSLLALAGLAARRKRK